MMRLSTISLAFDAAVLSLMICSVTACQRAHQTTLSCPSGSTLMGAPPPKGEEVWCQKIVDGRAVKNGLFIVYNDSGMKMIEGNYRDGMQEGDWTMWYENGQRSAIDHYQDGLQNGLHVSWYANGKKALEGEYRAGKREGVWSRWDPAGLVKKQMRYQAGKLVG